MTVEVNSLGSPAPSHTPLHDRYYPWFDWLRGALALTVMFWHDGLIPWSQAGNFAVQVFFALSGWLIGGILLQTEKADLVRFYFNRAVRIWVPYYIALTFILLAGSLRDHIGAKWVEVALYKLTFVYNLFGTNQLAAHAAEMPLGGTGNHLWSVNAEEQFYLMAPLLLVLAAPAIGRSLWVWLCVSFAAWYFGIGASIVFGVTAAVAHANGVVFTKSMPRAVVLAAGLSAAVGMATGGSYFAWVPVVAVCIVLLLSMQGPKQGVGALVGAISYPLYLNHWIGVFVAHALLSPWALRESALAHVVSTAVNVLLALALYKLIEQPLLAKRSQWYTESRGRRATLVAYMSVCVGLCLGLGFYLVSNR